MIQMRTLWMALAVALLFIGSGQCQSTPTSQWRKFSLAKGDFAVLLPGKPTEQKETENTEAGPITTYMFIVEKAPVVYVVGYTEYPAVVGLLSPKVLLDLSRDGMLEDEGGKSKLLGERSISLKNNPERAIQFRDADGLTGTARMYLVKRRMYEVLAMTPTEDEVASAGAIQRFLNPFELLGKYQPIEQTATWRKYSSTQGGFSVLTPGTPTYEKKTHKGAIGPQETYVFTHIGDTVMYMTMYQEFPGETSQMDTEAVLNGFRAGVLQGATNVWNQALPKAQQGAQKVKLLDERSISSGEWPGREVRFTDPGGLIYKMQFYLVRQKMYVLSAATAREREAASSKNIEKFLDSFELLQKPAPDTATTTAWLMKIGEEHKRTTR